MRIAFVAEGLAFQTQDSDNIQILESKKSSILYLARELSLLGHEILIFSPGEIGTSSNLFQFYNLSELHLKKDIDALISVDRWTSLLSQASAKKKFFWTDGSYKDENILGIGEKNVADQIDYFLAASKWQANTTTLASSFPRFKAWVLGRACDLDLFNDANSQTRKKHSLVYATEASAPLDFRAQFLPEIFTELKKEFTDLECHLFSNAIDQNSELKSRLLNLPGIQCHRSLPPKNLAQEFLKSSIWINPCRTEESSSLIAMIALGAGCVPIHSKRGALAEIIGNAGIAIENNKMVAEFISDFVQATRKTLLDDSLLSEFSEKAKLKFQDFSYRKLSIRFDGFLKSVCSEQ